VFVALSSIFSVTASIGYPLIFLIVMIETGCGIPVMPGEIALITGAIAASAGKLSIVLVILVAAAAAIVGDNIGYLIGRHGGRWLFERPGRFERQRHEVLTVGDWYFNRYGSKTVFFGRWLPVLRVYASWMAGGARMPWRVFALWNASGGILWAVSLGLFGYYGGTTAKTIIQDVGVYGILIVVIGIVVISTVFRRQGRRIMAAAALAEATAAERLASPTAEPNV